MLSLRTLWRREKVIMDSKIFFAHLSIEGSVRFSAEKYDLVSSLLQIIDADFSFPTYQTIRTHCGKSLLSVAYPDPQLRTCQMEASLHLRTDSLCTIRSETYCHPIQEIVLASFYQQNGLKSMLKPYSYSTSYTTTTATTRAVIYQL